MGSPFLHHHHPPASWQDRRGLHPRLLSIAPLGRHVEQRWLRVAPEGRRNTAVGANPRYAVCGMWYVVRGMWYTVRGTRYAAYTPHGVGHWGRVTAGRIVRWGYHVHATGQRYHRNREGAAAKEMGLRQAQPPRNRFHNNSRRRLSPCAREPSHVLGAEAARSAATYAAQGIALGRPYAMAMQPVGLQHRHPYRNSASAAAGELGHRTLPLIPQPLPNLLQ